MKIILEDSLVSHMKENDLHDIILELGMCIACGGEYKSVTARFVEKGETIDASNYDIEKTELGEIYLPKENMEYGETLRFVWKSYYWLDGLGVAGVKAINA